MDQWRTELRRAREALRLSRDALAAIAGVSAPAIKSYELGLRQPTHETLLALLDALKVDRHARNALLMDAGYAPDGRQLSPQNHNYAFSFEEAAETVTRLRWPAHVNNEFMEVVAANDIVQRIWDVDLGREYNEPVVRNMIAVATNPRFADRLVNWDEMVSVGISIMKGHHRGSEQLPEGQSHYFMAVMQHVLEGDPRYVQRLLALWERVPPRQPKIRWHYPVVWDHADVGRLQFTVSVTVANEDDGLYFNDWIPDDAQTLERVQKLMISHN